MPAFAGMMSCRQLTALYLAAGSGGGKAVPGNRPARRRGGRSGIPNGMPQGTPTGIPAGTAGSGGIPAPPTGAASTGGRFLGTPMGVLCEPPFGGFWRRERCLQLQARGMVPPCWAARFFGGTVSCRQLTARCRAAAGFGGGHAGRRPIGRRKRGGARQGPAGMLQGRLGASWFWPACRQAGVVPAMAGTRRWQPGPLQAVMHLSNSEKHF